MSTMRTVTRKKERAVSKDMFKCKYCGVLFYSVHDCSPIPVIPSCKNCKHKKNCRHRKRECVTCQHNPNYQKLTDNWELGKPKPNPMSKR